MLYRRTPELPPLRYISNGVIQDAVFPEDGSSNISAGELFLKALWLETSLTKDKDCNLPAVGAETVRTIVSRKYNADVSFKSSLNEICATLATIHDLSTDTISSDFISTDILCATVITSENITAKYGDIIFIDSDEISTDHLSADNGKINNISGTNLVYENGSIDNLSSTNITATNITATETADLSAAAAYWADLAELYKSNDIFEPGTLVKFNGKNEIELASNGIANGVISKNPALLLNASLKNKDCSNPLILVGRSVVKIKDKIDKFDRIELSDIPGIAQKATYTGKQILGISLESKNDSEINPVECIVKLAI